MKSVLVRRLSKLPALLVYFPFLASLIVFVWTKEPQSLVFSNTRSFVMLAE